MSSLLKTSAIVLALGFFGGIIGLWYVLIAIAIALYITGVV